MLRCLSFLFSVGLFVIGGPSFTHAQPSAPPSKDSARSADVFFTDGSVVKLSVLQENVEVLTKYGKLIVPTDDIRRIDMGLHMPEGYEVRIAASIRNLSSEAFRQREDASKDLLQLGHWALPSLQKASRSPELEVAKRSQALMQRITERTSPTILKIRPEDVIHTRDFPIVGRIVSTTLKAYWPLFGEQALPLSDLRSIVLRGQRGEAEFSIEAAKHGSALDQWFDTGINLDAQLRLSITSDGNVDLWPQTPGQYVAQPRGYNTPGKGGAFLAGALVGRIGETGRTFLVGDRYETNTTDEGKLYLQIIPSPWNNASSGSYRVRITTDHAGTDR